MEDKDCTIINIRNFPRELWWKAKALAAANEMTVRDLVVNLLTDATNKRAK
uniref:Uncharacterized protein n=1 Tax=viral metagenome TaxID=1070528 RepID=A0A6H1ZGI4_9ZZZZ